MASSVCSGLCKATCGAQRQEAQEPRGFLLDLSEAMVHQGDQSILGEEDHLECQVLVGNMDSKG